MWIVVINPIAGRGKGLRVGKTVTDFLEAHEIKYRIASGSSAQSTRQSLQTELENATCEGVIAVGGDGLVNLVVQEIARTNVPLLVIPAGTGNDFCRALGWSVGNVDEILNSILSKEPQRLDLGIANGSWFGAILSTGFDSEVNERANSMKWPRGPLKYNLAMLQELVSFKPRKYDITLDGRALSTSAMLIAVGNGISYGGGMKVCPGARLDDGQFDVMILKPVSTFEFLRVFPKVYKGSHISHPAVEVHRARSVILSAPAIAYADGERVGPLPVTAECVPGALLTWAK